jgi:hypothetical protein
VRNPFRLRRPPSPDLPRPNELAGGVARPNTLAGRRAENPVRLEENGGAEVSGSGLEVSAPGAEVSGLDAEAAADIARLTERLAILSPDEGRRLVSFWKTIDEGAREKAHEEVQAAARESGLAQVVNQLQERVAAQVNWHFSGSSIVGEGGAGMPPIPSLGPFKSLAEAVTWPVVDAVAAIALSDWLSDGAYDALYVPWERAIDEFTPPDDEPDDTDDADEPNDTDDGEPDDGEPDTPTQEVDELRA